ncbi:ATP synthase F1 subcomplex epsilon subunit [Balneicella halophila]|uniref:ATP synthase F1 subcomplex epsilon subunit n=1 Tax=Balneicella halophila TaxID=1537566 RepID=A0A7L4URG9_BALHA|nr:ATP synthase F1 subunit epsilon [Balneicella halophila]PVX52343.1 ATP synthase F1 subcomplex epsilon subunit [Balneicella halophila]
MKLDIISPDKKLYTGKVRLVQFPGADGYFEILKDHAPMISLLKEGNIKYIELDSTEEKLIEISGGVVELNNNEITVLAEE